MINGLPGVRNFSASRPPFWKRLTNQSAQASTLSLNWLSAETEGNLRNAKRSSKGFMGRVESCRILHERRRYRNLRCTRIAPLRRDIGPTSPVRPMSPMPLEANHPEPPPQRPNILRSVQQPPPT